MGERNATDYMRHDGLCGIVGGYGNCTCGMESARDAVEHLAVDRALWIRTVLAVSGTAPQRCAFIDGFNGYGPPPHPSRQMLEQHALGHQVHDVLHPQVVPNASPKATAAGGKGA